MGKLLLPVPTLCYECHDDFSSTFKVLHGPVASGNCNTCHNPHMAEGDKLTIRKGQQLCLYCHEIEGISTVKAHAEMGDTRCTQCHNPHGGDSAPFLITQIK
jgi:predicted CXXCH cytochrome family protein